MKLNKLIAQALKKPVKQLTVSDVIQSLTREVSVYDTYGFQGMIFVDPIKKEVKKSKRP